jgi:ATP-dependent DNA ligase
MLMRSPLARDRREPPGFIRPCKPVLSLKVPTGAEWIHEMKHDGFRLRPGRVPNPLAVV